MLAILKVGATIPTITEWANVISKCILGTIDLGTLSTTYWNVAGSMVVMDSATGWSDHDSAAGTAANGVTPSVYATSCGLYEGNPAYLHMYSISATEVAFSLYHTWDAATNTGTYRSHIPATGGWGCINKPYGANTDTLVVMSGGVGELFIGSYSNGNCACKIMVADLYANDRYMDASMNTTDPENWSPLVILGDVGTAPTTAAASSGAFTKIWNPYTASIHTTTQNQFSSLMCQCTAYPSGLFVTSPVYGMYAAASSASQQSTAAVRNTDETKSAYIPAYRLGITATGANIGATNPGTLGGAFKTSNILLTRATWNNYDEVTIGTNDYVVMALGSAAWAKLLFKKR